MFSHIMVGADDIPAAKTFYDAALGALGLPEGVNMGDRVMYRTDEGVFMVTRPLDGKPACFANGGTIGFNAPNPEAVDRFHDAGIEAGGKDEGKPGPRPAVPGSYAAYLRDPTGNKIVAWCMKEG
jgi:catechol 2,3-dioxygenase-like lactoylglutathione lyase family enzyme